MNLQEIRDYVRNHLDLELEDLPDPVVDVFIREGSRKVEYSEQRWPFYEDIVTWSTIAGGASTPFADISPTLRRISAIVHADNRALQWISTEAAADRFNAEQTGRPTHYGEWGENLLLFPTPDEALAVTIYGYRKQTDWTAGGAGAEPDLPEELHNTVALWALHRAYAQQEDPEMAGLYRNIFDQELNEFGRRMTEMPLTRPLVMNRTRRRPRSRPRFDWEVS
jgi:hypothetical protein